ncbi:helix-turn-helix domain-containing protein [Streptomyces sp. NPDC006692]|uniref:helix-turn-helix domain-containing protein n=1 Tax=unclassified Streptomyces TaxID=2593676 RepID=UPI0034184D5C
MTTASSPASPPCAPPCHIPSLPPVLVGALLRHHRTRAGLSLQNAAHATGESASRIGAAETAGLRLSGARVRALLDLYGTPAPAIQHALKMVTLAGHQHRIDLIAPPQAWVDALVAGSRSVLVYTADPNALTLLAPTATPQPGAAPRQPAAERRCRKVLLLHESLLDYPVDRAAALSHLVRQAESDSLTVHLIPGRLPAPAPLVTEYTNTAWRWDGSDADRLRRQIYVTHQHDATQTSLRNGPAAQAERQVLEQAARTAQSSQWSLHRIRQVLTAAENFAPTEPRTSPTAPCPARRTA